MPDAWRTPNGQYRGTTRSDHVLIADDDPNTREVIGRYLEDNNFPVVTVSSRASVQHHPAMAEPRLILLDLGSDGELDVLREIRSHSDVPIILMMGRRPNEADTVLALELGADVCMVKPVSLRNLLAVVRALLRRQEMARRGREPEPGGYKFEGWRLERPTRHLFDPHGMPVRLTKGQYALLVAFLDAPKQPLSREHLLQATRVHEDIFDRSVDVQVTRLRRKLQPNPTSPKLILAKRRFGYVLACDVERY